MADNFGILVTQPGISTTNAPANKVLLNTKNPFIKIDTQNTAGFTTILLIIVTEPPEPVPNGTTNTTLYKFKHNYSYVPSIESLFYVTVQPVAPYNNGTQLYFQDSGQIGAASVNASASLRAITDATYIYIICSKVNFDSGVSKTNLSGTSVQITVHVFVDDIGV